MWRERRRGRHVFPCIPFAFRYRGRGASDGNVGGAAVPGALLRGIGTSLQIVAVHVGRRGQPPREGGTGLCLVAAARAVGTGVIAPTSRPVTDGACTPETTVTEPGRLTVRPPVVNG